MGRISRTATVSVVLLAAVLYVTPASAWSLRKLLSLCQRDRCGIWCGPPRKGACALDENYSPSRPVGGSSYAPQPVQHTSHYSAPPPRYEYEYPTNPPPAADDVSHYPDAPQCSVDANPKCKPSYAYDPASYKCISQDYQSVDYSCDGDYTLQVVQGEHTCVMQDYKDTEPRCPEGYQIRRVTEYDSVAYRCENVLYAQFSASCPDTYELTTDEYQKDTCYYQDTQDAYSECPSEDYNIVHGQCYREQSQDPYLACETPYILKDGMCEYITYQDASLECGLPSYQLIDGKCRYEQKKDPYAFCNEGYEMGSNKCYYSMTYEPRLKCPYGYDVSKDEDKCISQTKTLRTPSYRCRYGSIQGNKCAEPDSYGGVSYTDPEFVCLDGWKYDSNNRYCVKRGSVPGQYACDDGDQLEPTAHGQACRKTIQEDFGYNCEDGYDLAYHANNGKFECISTDIIDGEYKCPSGYQVTSGYGKVQCSMADYSDPEPRCLEGYALETQPGYEKQLCFKRDFVPLVYKCSDNSYSLYETTKCQKDYYQDVIYSCPHGYDNKNGQCTLYESGPEPTQYCKDQGYTISDGRCTYYDEYPANTACQGPYELRDGQCYYSWEEDVTWTCDYGWVLQDRVCWGPCPADYVESSSADEQPLPKTQRTSPALVEKPGEHAANVDESQQQTTAQEQAPSAKGPEQQGSAAQKPRQQGPTTQQPQQQGPATHRRQQQGPATQEQQQQGPATQKPQQQGPVTQEPQQQGPATQEPQQQSPATQKSKQQGPATQRHQQQGPATQKPQQQGPATQRRQQQGPATQKPQQQGPATQRPQQQQGPATQKPQQQGPATQKPQQQQGPTTPKPQQQGPATQRPQQQQGPTTQKPQQQGPATQRSKQQQGPESQKAQNPPATNDRQAQKPQEQAAPVDPEEGKGCIDGLPFGLEHCVCDGAEIGAIAGQAACTHVTTECSVTAFSDLLDATMRICDTFALDACISAAENVLEELPGCKAVVEEGSENCTSEQASKLFYDSVLRACEPLCPDCERKQPA